MREIAASAPELVVTKGASTMTCPMHMLDPAPNP